MKRQTPQVHCVHMWLLITVCNVPMKGWMDSGSMFGWMDRVMDVEMAGAWDGELGKWTKGYMKEE